MRNGSDEIDILLNTVSGSVYLGCPEEIWISTMLTAREMLFKPERVVNRASQTAFLFVVNTFSKEARIYVGKTNDLKFIELGKAAEYGSFMIFRMVVLLLTARG